MGKRKFDEDELHWYALDVVRQKEHLAGHILSGRMGCMTFIPTETRFRKQNRYRKGKIEVAYAGIPGTIFAGFDGAPDWFAVMSMHLVNGVLSVDDQPRRIDTAGMDWITYRSKQIDGCMTIERQALIYRGDTIERSVRLIQLQGRGVLRSPVSIKARANHDRPVVIRAAGARARALGAILAGPQLLLAAA